MVRLKDRDDLQDQRGKLGASFTSVIVDGLQARIGKNGHTQKLLEGFMHAALRVRSHENIFNSRARTQGELQNHLRDPEHMIALRTLRAADDALQQAGGADATALAKIVKNKITFKN